MSLVSVLDCGTLFFPIEEQLYFIKDRMERSGMRWTIESAQAMLDVRSTYLNGDWDDFMRYRIAQETQRLYPYRVLVEPSETLEVIELPLAA